jgi:hypothetical protein
VFSERTANYEAFCQMRIKILKLNDQAKEKFKNRQRTLKKYRFNVEDDKKAKISRVRVPLRQPRRLL